MSVEYMTTAEVAELCRTSAESVRWWRHVGRGPRSFRVGRRVLYETTEVRQWLAALKAGGESAGTEQLARLGLLFGNGERR